MFVISATLPMHDKVGIVFAEGEGNRNEMIQVTAVTGDDDTSTAYGELCPGILGKRVKSKEAFAAFQSENGT